MEELSSSGSYDGGSAPSTGPLAWMLRLVTTAASSSGVSHFPVRSSTRSGVHARASTQQGRSLEVGSAPGGPDATSASSNYASEGSHVVEIVAPRNLHRHLPRTSAASPQNSDLSRAPALSETVASSSSSGSLSPSTGPLPAINERVLSAAASAEEHRLNSGETMDLQAALAWFEHMAPYMCLLTFIFSYTYALGVLEVMWLLGAQMHVNQSFRKQVALKSNWQFMDVLSILGYILVTMLSVSWLTLDLMPWRGLVFLLPLRQLSMTETLFQVLMADSIARFLGTVLKVGVLLGCQLREGGGTGKALRQQGRLLTAFEHANGLYRTVLPIGPWYMYFLSAVPQPVVASLVTGAYLATKCQHLWQRVKLVWLAANMVTRRGAVYGTYARGEDLEAGGCCPICQDPISVGVRLECGHVFCEEDISEWLERDRTCPMCRANVRPPGLTSYSDGTTSLLPQAF